MPPQPVPQQEYARVVLIIVLLFFLYASPDQGPPPGFPTARDYAAERIAASHRSLDILNITKWQDFSPKGPGSSKHEAPSDEARGKWRAVEDDKNGLMLQVYENVTGIVKGRWVRHTADINGEPRKRVMNLTEIAPGTDWAFTGEEYWIRNITGSEGKLMMRLDEKQVEEVDYLEDGALSPINAVRSAVATITIQDETSSGDGWEMRVHGLHWPKQGVMLFTTTSDKFHGIYGLPHLTPSREHYLSSQKLLNRTLEHTIEGMEKAIWADPGNPFTSSPDNQADATMPVPHCELVVYVQVYLLKVDLATSAGHLDPANIVQQIEQEIRFPNGAPIPVVPKLQMSAVMFSPDCGFMIESKGPPDFAPGDGEHLLGKKQELFLHDIQSWLHVFALVIFGQILLLKIQSKEASTPSTIGRVILTLLLFISLSSISWPISVRTFYVNALAMLYLSIWLPQIRRNIIRNCRKALLWKFIVGQSVLRLLPFAYFYLKEDNILFAETDWKAFCVLAGWVWVQIWVLAAQEILGPRWGLPKNWYEEGWDYHPILREDNVEAGGLPIGLVQIPGSPTLERTRTSEELGRKKSDGGVRTVDCAICMQVLEVPVVGAGEDASANAGGVAGMLARRLYMVTPCRHVFHRLYLYCIG
ncbi:hypothetical protein NA56DRAFT_679007 [Hyaloscypha hepaticicola]|uniref:RING-type E3 ubiquitin transferase n=1 Tax=Hyaloscypha hepaticicola TaxID=2082293 RepID=A0A2J6Q6T7_9HELO|nr:hypothetical protein NA56DRAFT_679007 [Hyaloscypha hepaticicola]